MNFEVFERERKERVKEAERVIKAYLPKEEGVQKTVLEAMNYSVLAGGKRLRPVLALETYRMFGGKGKEIEPFMAALEMVHTYSLVHDDLPAMDNDAYRRGRETTHVRFGEAMAILAGDGLLNLAFETLAKAFSLGDAGRVSQALGVFAQKAGVYGMIGGQTADIEAEEMGEKVTEEQLLFIHEHKTAALIESALMMGAILAGACETDVKKTERIGRCLGVAFQIQDDILDVEGDAQTLGKPVGSDEKNKKITYVTLKGLKQAGEDQKRLSREAVCLLQSFDNRNIFLEDLVASLTVRDK